MPIDFTRGSILTSLARYLDGSNWSNRSILAWSAGSGTARSDGPTALVFASLDGWQQSDQLCWRYLW
jgi:hypothetical protein